MKKTSRKLALSRVSIAKLGQASGAYWCASFNDGCSNSCNTCDDGNWTCWVIDDSDFCDGNFSNGCPDCIPSNNC